MHDLRRSGRASVRAPFGFTSGAALWIVLLLSLASCATGAHGPAEISTPATFSLEQQTHSKINAYRASKGMPPLTWSDLIAEQARRHSQDMASGKTRFGHGGFKGRVAIISRSIPWSRAGENVAISRTAAGAVDMWLKSRGHRREIESNFNLTGIGVARSSSGSVYFTQIFIKSK